MSEKFGYYLWRIKIIACIFKHDWNNIYIRNSESGNVISGRDECARCFQTKYFMTESK